MLVTIQLANFYRVTIYIKNKYYNLPSKLIMLSDYCLFDNNL